MKLSIDQLEAAAFIFEHDNGNVHSDYEKQSISESGISEIEPSDLEKQLIEDLDNGVYNDLTERISAYWALGKRFSKRLIPTFQKWLKNELESNQPIAVYQLLIALNNLEEPVFHPDRDGSTASWETDLNLKDAADYLK